MPAMARVQGWRRRAVVLGVVLGALAAGDPARAEVNVGLVPGNAYNAQERLVRGLGAKQERYEVEYSLDPAGSDPKVVALRRRLSEAMSAGVKPLVLLNAHDLHPGQLSPATYAAGVERWAEFLEPSGAFMAGRDPKLLADLELWNEPYLWFMHGANPVDPAAYAAHVKAASARIRAVSGRLRIAIAADTTGIRRDGTQVRWIEGLYAAGLTNAMFDLVAAHPYAYRRALDASPEDRWAFGRLRRIIERFRANGYRDRFILSEYGAPSGPSSDTSVVLGADEWGQDEFWRRSLALLNATPLYRDNVETVYAYCGFDFGSGADSGDHMGLFRWVDRRDQDASSVADLAPKLVRDTLSAKMGTSVVPGAYPDRPSGSRLKLNGPTELEHRWDPLPGASGGYVVELKRPDGRYVRSTVPAGTTRKVHTGLAAGGYGVTVRALSSPDDGRGRWAGWTEATVGPLAASFPSAPRRHRSWSTGDAYAEHAWDPVAGADAYEVVLQSPGRPDAYRRTTQTSYRWTGLQNGRGYRVGVIALKGTAAGAWAGEIPITPSP